MGKVHQEYNLDDDEQHPSKHPKNYRCYSPEQQQREREKAMKQVNVNILNKHQTLNLTLGHIYTTHTLHNNMY